MIGRVSRRRWPVRSKREHPALTRARPALVAAAFAIFGLVPLVLLALVAVGTGGSAVKDNVRDSLRLSSRLSALYVQSELTGLGEVAESFAHRPTLVKVIERGRRGRRSASDRAYVRLTLHQLRAVRSGIGVAFLADANGNLVDIVPETPSIVGKDFSFRDWYKGVTRTGRVYISESYESQARGHPQVVAVAAPVMTFGPRPRRIGILVAAYEVSRLRAFTVAAARAQGLEVEVTDQRGLAIDGASPLRSLKDDPLVAAALAGRSGVGEQGTGGERRLAAYDPLPELGWTAIALLRAKTAYAPVSALRTRVFVIALLLASLLLLGGWFLARMMRQRYHAEEEMSAALDRASSLAMVNRSMIEAMEGQNERLRELDRMKDDFVASVSHELRTPLTSIRGYLDLVREGEAGELTGEAQHFLSVVDRNADRLLRLVGDLLFVAQVDAGKISLEHGTVDLIDLAREAIDAAGPAAAHKNIELTLETAVLPKLEADRARLSQVLDNLVSNAVKFTPEGGHVEVRVFAEDRLALVEVSDDGMGISVEEQPRLFERFFRTEEAAAGAIQGTGLGLAIVKAIVESHGGVISVESAVGRGTTFRVAFPIPEAAASEEEDSPNLSSAPA